ncbi:MAG TPA: hypothetical protein VFB22_05085 [Candidatus Baltobacteraceae bacterium]|nr:hypothetical protein [Candidatus Baltobacteraceae bacterium]
MACAGRDAWKIESAPIPFPDYGVAIVIAGACDAYVEMEDHVRLVVDYETTTTVDARRHADQLRAYGFALRNPGATRARSTSRRPLRAAGLQHRRNSPRGRPASPGMYGATAWIEVQPDDAPLFATLRRVAGLLSGVEPPKPNARCPYCIYYGAVATLAGSAV